MPPGFALVPGNSYTIEGDCVRRIRAIGPRTLRLTDRAVEINPDGSMTFGQPYGFEYVQAVPVGPRIGRAPVLAVDVVSGETRIGVWKTNDGWTVASFTGMSKPRALLRSKTPIIAVNYSSLYHWSSGELSLVQQLTPTKARLLNYSLRIPGL